MRVEHRAGQASEVEQRKLTQWDGERRKHAQQEQRGRSGKKEQ